MLNTSYTLNSELTVISGDDNHSVKTDKTYVLVRGIINKLLKYL